ncbi:hypothetical protein [Aeromicrobium sp. UC242_57]|uniref:hypothetical protein n=1 Tax=Aeromicrobium sp. UC242_57 TaxID=3374624 RepID=UPI0037BD6391
MADDDEILAGLSEQHPDLTFTKVPGVDSWIGVDADGNFRMRACGRYEPDPVTAAQDAIETGSQVVGADDEWA